MDTPTSTVLVAFFVLVGQIFNIWQANRIHKLVNSNYTEQKNINAQLQTKVDDMNTGIIKKLEDKEKK